MPSSEKPKRRVDLQATGHQVRQNIQRVRKASGLSHTALSQKMSEAGHQVSKTAVSEIENGARRVSADDLLAIAVALGVSPLELLLPPNTDDPYRITGVGKDIPGADTWAWALMRIALDFDGSMEESHARKVSRLKQLLRKAKSDVLKEERRLIDLKSELKDIGYPSIATLPDLLSSQKTRSDVELELEQCRQNLADAELRREEAQEELDLLEARGPLWER